MASSLRSLVAGNSSDDDNNIETVTDDGGFVFTDQAHGRDAFRRLSQSLVDFGLIAEDDSHGDKVDEKSFLLDDDGDDSDYGDEVVKKEEKDIKPSPLPPPTTPSGKSSSRLRELIHKNKSQIHAYHKGQKEAFLSVVDELDSLQKQQEFKNWKFTWGLLNCLCIAYAFGALPQHFWILYAVETVFWMTYKFRNMLRARPLCEALYYLDFCWVMNTLGVSYTVLLIVSGHLHGEVDSAFATLIPIEWRRQALLAAFGIFCGPVFMAGVMLPFVAFLFHDVNTMANLVIHLMPCMTMYNFRWHAAEIYAAYPTYFPSLLTFVEELNNGTTGSDGSSERPSVARAALGAYFLWFIPYTIWMLAVGLRLPAISKEEYDAVNTAGKNKKIKHSGKPPTKPYKFDTVFHSTWKGGHCELFGTVLWKRPKAVSRDQSQRNDFETRDLLFYMTMHAVGSCGIGIFLFGDLLCYRGGKMVHAVLIFLAMVVCAERGAKRYTYYVTAMYGKKLRKAFGELEQKQKQEQQQQSLPAIAKAQGDPTKPKRQAGKGWRRSVRK